jgi:hypothetical protein
MPSFLKILFSVVHVTNLVVLALYTLVPTLNSRSEVASVWPIGVVTAIVFAVSPAFLWFIDGSMVNRRKIWLLFTFASGVIWARLFWRECWTPLENNCVSLEDALSTGVIAVALSVGLTILIGFVSRGANASFVTDSVLGRLRGIGLILLAVGSAYLVMQAIARGAASSASTTDPDSLGLGLAILFLTLLASILVMLGLRAIFVFERSNNAAAILANLRSIRSGDEAPLNLKFESKTLGRGTAFLAAEYGMYGALIVAILIIYISISVFAETHLWVGFVAVLGAIVVSVFGSYWHFRDGHHKDIVGTLASASFGWGAPISGVAIWVSTSQLDQFAFLLITIPEFLFLGWFLGIWLPRKVRGWATGRNFAINSFARLRNSPQARFVRFSARVKNQIYARDSLRVWQIILSVGVFGLLWGGRTLESLTRSEELGEAVTSFESIDKSVLLVGMWALISQFPALNYAVRVVARGGKDGSASAATKGMRLLLPMVLIVAFGIPLMIPAFASLALFSELFDSDGVALVIQFWIIPILIPWFYSILLSIWLIATYEIRQTVRIVGDQSQPQLSDAG